MSMKRGEWRFVGIGGFEEGGTDQVLIILPSSLRPEAYDESCSLRGQKSCSSLGSSILGKN